MATLVTQAGRDSICSPRSERSQARARASCTASSAVARLPVINATPATSRGYVVARNSLIVTSSSSCLPSLSPD